MAERKVREGDGDEDIMGDHHPKWLQGITNVPNRQLEGAAVAGGFLPSKRRWAWDLQMGYRGKQAILSPHCCPQSSTKGSQCDLLKGRTKPPSV
jgi:hypothetical protein